jgi:hypothetical protein
MAMLLSRWLVAQGHDRSILGDDLGKIVSAVARSPHKGSTSWLAQVVAPASRSREDQRGALEGPAGSDRGGRRVSHSSVGFPRCAILSGLPRTTAGRNAAEAYRAGLGPTHSGHAVTNREIPRDSDLTGGPPHPLGIARGWLRELGMRCALALHASAKVQSRDGLASVPNFSFGF